MSTFARAARLLPWCELAAIEFDRDPAEAERIMRAGLVATS